MSASHGFNLWEAALVRHCRHVPEFVGGRRGAAEPVKAAVYAGLGDGCSGVGHLQDGPELPAALHQTSSSAHAALPYKAPQVQTIKTWNKELSMQVTSLSAHHAGFSLRKCVLCFIHSNLFEDCEMYFFAQELSMQNHRNCCEQLNCWLQLQFIQTPSLLPTISLLEWLWSSGNYCNCLL